MHAEGWYTNNIPCPHPLVQPHRLRLRLGATPAGLRVRKPVSPIAGPREQPAAKAASSTSLSPAARLAQVRVLWCADAVAPTIRNQHSSPGGEHELRSQTRPGLPITTRWPQHQSSAPSTWTTSQLTLPMISPSILAASNT